MSFLNRDKFGNIIHDGDIVFYTTSSRYSNERVGKVFYQVKGKLGMMSDSYNSSLLAPPSNHGDPFNSFRPERRWYNSNSAIVITSLVPQKIIDKLDQAYADWRKKNVNKEF